MGLHIESVMKDNRVESRNRSGEPSVSEGRAKDESGINRIPSCRRVLKNLISNKCEIPFKDGMLQESGSRHNCSSSYYPYYFGVG